VQWSDDIGETDGIFLGAGGNEEVDEDQHMGFNFESMCSCRQDGTSAANVNENVDTKTENRGNIRKTCALLAQACERIVSVENDREKE
jgi:hypothetical protein